MDQEHDCPRTGTVVALAGELDKLHQVVAAKADTDEMERLAKVVTDLAETVSATRAGAESVPPPSWLTLPGDVRAARGLLDDLVGWMGSVYLRYADGARELPECWLWHPDVVEELVWLMHAWLSAYTEDGGSVRAAGDWHDRLRPAVVRRIGEYVRTCSLESHLPDRAARARSVPVADAADQIAVWWGSSRDELAPAPTDEQIAAADADRRGWGGGR